MEPTNQEIEKRAERDFYRGKDATNDNPYTYGTREHRIWDETNYDLWQDERKRRDDNGGRFGYL